MSQVKTVFVLWWAYHDNSKVDILRVYEEKEQAQRDFDMIESILTDRELCLNEVDMIGEG